MRFEKVASKERLLELLIRYDDSAVRTISSRAGDLERYAEKLFAYGENFVAADGTKELGFVSFYGNDNANDMIYLTIIAVDSESRGQGYGTAILEYLENFGKRSGRNRIKLEVDKGNDGAVCFYRKNGFKITSNASSESFFMEKEMGRLFYWEKKGLVFNPAECKERPFWRWNFAQGENALLFDEFIRVYFCCRERPNERGETISRVSYVDLDKKDPMRVVRVCDRPVLQPGELGTFDEFGTYPFSVIRIDDKIYGYYGGVTRCESVPFQVSIGCAVSKDNGESFQRIGKGPVLTSSLQEPFMICSPKVRCYHGKWYLFYSAGTVWTRENGRAEICYKLRMAMSEDGINWKKCGRTILEDKLGPLESQACGDVIFCNGKYHMFFCYRNHTDFRKNPDNAYRIGYASSRDLFHWVREDEKAGIDVSEDEKAWDSQMVAYPNVFQCNGKTYMLYLGNEVGKMGFGLAELKGELI